MLLSAACHEHTVMECLEAGDVVGAVLDYLDLVDDALGVAVGVNIDELAPVTLADRVRSA